jgi:YebC/PmpR family DNA-binding regulatory protein
MAVKEGGPDPDSNSRLRAVIQNAKSINMPKENVERAIKRASDKNQGDYKVVLFEGYAPHGIAVLVETATDNNNRTVANVRMHFSKSDGNLGTSGSVEFMFDHTCNFRIPADGLDPEELELELIDFGAEEVFEDEDGIHIYAPFESFGAIQKELERRDIEILSSGFERIPQVTKNFNQRSQQMWRNCWNVLRKMMTCNTCIILWKKRKNKLSLTYFLKIFRLFTGYPHRKKNRSFEDLPPYHR